MFLVHFVYKVLFRRECKGRFLEMRKCLCCRKKSTDHTLNMRVLWEAEDSESENGEVKAVYVTQFGANNLFSKSDYKIQLIVSVCYRLVNTNLHKIIQNTFICVCVCNGITDS